MKTKTAIKPNGNGVKVAYSYRRFSSRQQSTGTSLARQKDIAWEVATAKDWRLVDLPPDKGVSGWKITDLDGQQAANFHKGNLGAFLKRVQGGDIAQGSVLIVERLDRFSRNYVDLVLNAFLDLMHAGIELYSCVDQTHYTLADIRKDKYLLHRLLDHIAFANEYSTGMSDKISKAFKTRRADAASGKKINLGSWQPRWIDFNGSKGQEGTFTFNDYAKTVKRIVLDYVGGKTYGAIVRALIAEKEPSAQGGKWGSGTIENILHNQALTGTITIKTVKLENYYPALITDMEYNALQAKLSDNKNKKGGNPSTDVIANLFRNRVKCVCGGSVRAEHGFYRCRNREIGTCKHKGSIAIKNVEEDFFALFLQEQPTALLGKHTPKHNAEIARLKARINEIEKGIDDATALVGKFPISQLEATLTALVQDKEALNEQLETASHKLLSASNAPLAFDSIKKAIRKTDDVNLDKVMREMIKQLQDNDTRKRLLEMLPTLVQRLEMNMEKGQYRVVNASGEVSEWEYVGD
jgi:DNA invertase Pin-like site-specific DNA recombinase